MNLKKVIFDIEKNNKPLFEKVFRSEVNEASLRTLSEMSLNSYLIAITPRSGSSYFIDLLRNTKLLGEPAEYLNPGLIPNIAKAVGANNFSDYWLKLVNRPNCKDIHGVKASYFQFLPIIETGLDEVLFNNTKIILLKRKNIVQQAVSLYFATQTEIFHTNISHSDEKWNQLEKLNYSNDKIMHWVKHIYTQEVGWDNYLKNKDFLSLSYEDVLENPSDSVMRSLAFLKEKSVDKDFSIESVFKKIGNNKNQQFCDQFLSEKNNLVILSDLGVSAERMG